MSFFERWFGNQEAAAQQPNVRFGRYSDSYKETENYDAWDQSLSAFENGDHLAAYLSFLQFLRDETEDNVKWESNTQGLSFELFQGSKRIIGWATKQSLRVEARIARVTNFNPELLRRFVAHNYSLKFSRYALDPDQHITVVFDTDTLDASPYKLYYALKELATQADKQDDLLLEEFGELKGVDSSHLEALPQAETKVKLDFIRSKVRKALQTVAASSIDNRKFAGGISYVLLALIYKLDYLVKPEGFTMEALERIHRQYFAKEPKQTAEAKNQQISKELQALLERSEREYSREMYQVKTTFGITSAVTHDRIVHLIDGELHHMDWYKENGFTAIAKAIPAYLIGYSLFNYAIPQPDRDFFHLFYRVTEPQYFNDLGFETQCCHPETNKLDRRAIRKAIDAIVKKHRNQYPRLRPLTSSLIFDDLITFSKSYLLMIRNLDLSKME